MWIADQIIFSVKAMKEAKHILFPERNKHKYRIDFSVFCMGNTKMPKRFFCLLLNTEHCVYETLSKIVGNVFSFNRFHKYFNYSWIF